MAIIYTWDVSQVDTYPTVGSNTDVIHSVNWSLDAKDDVNSDSIGMSVASTTGGQTIIGTSDLTDFVAFADVTTADVQGWVDADLGVDRIAALKSGLAADIAEIVTPSSVTKTLIA